MTTLKSFFFLSFFFIQGLNAQPSNKPVQLLHYILDSFSTGKILMKSGVTTEQRLNYNLLTEEMIFQSNGSFMAIANPQEVDTVFIQNRKFVPVDSRFYECLTGDEPALFEEYTCSIREPGAETGFGATNTSATTSLNSLVKSGGAYELKLPNEFKVIPGHNYWLKKEGKFFKINSGQQLVKLFPSKKQWIVDWMKAKNTNFSKQEDVIALVKSIQ